MLTCSALTRLLTRVPSLSCRCGGSFSDCGLDGPGGPRPPVWILALLLRGAGPAAETGRHGTLLRPDAPPAGPARPAGGRPRAQRRLRPAVRPLRGRPAPRGRAGRPARSRRPRHHGAGAAPADRRPAAAAARTCEARCRRCAARAWTVLDVVALLAVLGCLGLAALLVLVLGAQGAGSYVVLGFLGGSVAARRRRRAGAPRRTASWARCPARPRWRAPLSVPASPDASP